PGGRDAKLTTRQAELIAAHPLDEFAEHELPRSNEPSNALILGHPVGLGDGNAELATKLYEAGLGQDVQQFSDAGRGFSHAIANVRSMPIRYNSGRERLGLAQYRTEMEQRRLNNG
ncbi:MAG TPA: hypothetical protein VG963_14465, partial [Polyangiaceae bacterium]|nr:hypothetical protein [Polyangiaceae bacterium]